MKRIKTRIFFTVAACFLLSVAVTANLNAQCVDCTGGELGYITEAPAFAPGWSVISEAVEGGQFIRFRVEENKVYRWSTLGDEDFNESIYPVPSPCYEDGHCGGDDPMYICRDFPHNVCELAFDTQLTLLTACDGDVLAYNRNAVFRNQSEIEWKAESDGDVILYITKHDCQHSSLTTTLKWQEIDSSWCDDCEYYSPRPYDHEEPLIDHYQYPVSAPEWSPVGNDPDFYPDPFNPGIIRSCNHLHPDEMVSGKELGYCFDYDENIKGGDYQTYYVEEGKMYRWTTCGGPAYDTQLTLFRNTECGKDFLAYSDDDPDCIPQSTIVWKADVSGPVTLLTNMYNCSVCEMIFNPFDPFEECPKTTLRWQRYDCQNCTVPSSHPAPSTTETIVDEMQCGEYFQLDLQAGLEYSFEAFDNGFEPVVTLREVSGDPCEGNVIAQGKKVTWKPFSDTTVEVHISTVDCDCDSVSGSDRANLVYKVDYDPADRFDDEPVIDGTTYPDITLDKETGVYFKDTEEYASTWTEAMQICGDLDWISWTEDGEELSLVWRLGNINELTSIIDYDLYDKATSMRLPSYFTGADGGQDCSVNNQATDCSAPAYPANICGNDAECVRNNWYWSNSTVHNAPNFAWIVNMMDGRTYRGLKDDYEDEMIEQISTSYKVLCVGAVSRVVDCENALPANAVWSDDNPDGKLVQECYLDSCEDHEWVPDPNTCTWECEAGYTPVGEECTVQDGDVRIVDCVDNKPENSMWVFPNSYGTVIQTWDSSESEWVPPNDECAWDCVHGYTKIGDVCEIAECGDGIVDPDVGEVCDIKKAGGEYGAAMMTCSDYAASTEVDWQYNPDLIYLGDSTYATCDNCTGYDLSKCHYCGDGTVYLWEECDDGISYDVGALCAAKYGVSSHNVYPYPISTADCSDCIIDEECIYCGDGQMTDPSGLVLEMRLDGDPVNIYGPPHGTASNISWIDDGAWGGAAHFNGSNSNIIVPGDSAINNLSTFTVETWVRSTHNVTGFPDAIFVKDNWAMWHEPHNGVSFIVEHPDHTGTPGCGVHYGKKAGENINTWTHIAATFSNATGNLTLYANGFHIRTVSCTGGMAVVPATSLSIGAEDTHIPFTGDLDEIRIYNRVLSQREINYNMRKRCDDADPEFDAQDACEMVYGSDHTYYHTSSAGCVDCRPDPESLNCEYCGDGDVQDGHEDCDDGGDNTWNNRCNPDCKWNRCVPVGPGGIPESYNTGSDKWTYNPDFNKCYQYSSSNATFSAAQSACEAKGGNLVNIASVAENNWIKDHIVPAGTDYWTGLYVQEAPTSGNSAGLPCSTGYGFSTSTAVKHSFTTSSSGVSGCSCGGVFPGNQVAAFRFTPQVTGNWRIVVKTNDDNAFNVASYNSCACSNQQVCSHSNFGVRHAEFTHNFSSGVLSYIMISTDSSTLSGTIYFIPPSQNNVYPYPPDQFRWTDGYNHSYENFQSGQPDGSGNCVYVWGSSGSDPYGWDDNLCTQSINYVCQRSPE